MRYEDKTKDQLIQELVELRRQLAAMGEQVPRTEEVCVDDEQGAVCATPDAAAAYGTEEPWLRIETKLVIGSVIAGMITLIVLATLVHMFLLGGH
jgi:hypothetical protein